MRILVVTVVHRPDDARVFERQIGALLAAGHEVTLAAPWRATAVDPLPGVTAVDLPRSSGRHRLTALRAARRVIGELSGEHDIVLIHNFELLAVIGKPSRPIVWDVHEDLGAALVDKKWLPRVLRPLVRLLVRAMERRAEAKVRIILAETSYAERFRKRHPVVPNEPVVPEHVGPPGDGRVIHLGRHSHGRGVVELIETGEALPEGIEMVLMGWADPEVEPLLRQAVRRGVIQWEGTVPNHIALERIEGSLAGLSLLQDLPNYRHSRPTKVVEYMSRGIPVITTPLEKAREIVMRHECGVVVPFRDPSAVVAAVRELASDESLRERLGRNGHRAALEEFNWARSGPRFVRILENWAAGQDVDSYGDE